MVSVPAWAAAERGTERRQLRLEVRQPYHGRPRRAGREPGGERDHDEPTHHDGHDGTGCYAKPGHAPQYRSGFGAGQCAFRGHPTYGGRKIATRSSQGAIAAGPRRLHGQPCSPEEERCGTLTILRLDNSLAAELLLAHLCDRTDVAAEAVDAVTLRVSLVGSYRAETMEMELILRVRAWQEALRAKGVEVEVELLDERDTRGK